MRYLNNFFKRLWGGYNIKLIDRQRDQNDQVAAEDVLLVTKDFQDKERMKTTDITPQKALNNRHVSP